VKPRPADERTEVLRVRVPLDVWQYFRRKRDGLRRWNPEAGVPTGDAGTRLLLRVWIEEALRGGS
jgi:hypothetical protein